MDLETLRRKRIKKYNTKFLRQYLREKKNIPPPPIIRSVARVEKHTQQPWASCLHASALALKLLTSN